MKTFFYLSMMLLMASGIYAQKAKPAVTDMSTRHASLSGKTGAVTRADIYKSPEITVEGDKCTVKEFKLTIKGSGSREQEFSGHGSKLDDKMIAAVKNAPPHA